MHILGFTAALLLLVKNPEDDPVKSFVLVNPIHREK